MGRNSRNTAILAVTVACQNGKEKISLPFWQGDIGFCYSERTVWGYFSHNYNQVKEYNNRIFDRLTRLECAVYL